MQVRLNKTRRKVIPPSFRKASDIPNIVFAPPMVAQDGKLTQLIIYGQVDCLCCI